jgi:hypothetical protein
MPRPAALARTTAGLTLVTLLGGCALMGSGDEGASDRHEAWIRYFSGEDLRDRCDEGEPDHFRLAYQRPGQPDIHVVEAIGNIAGGAMITAHDYGPAELAHSHPPAPGDPPDAPLPLRPRHFSALVYWLDRLGVLSPNPGLPGPADAKLSWMVCGCLNGSWVVNTHQLLDDGGGIAARFGRR